METNNDKRHDDAENQLDSPVNTEGTRNSSSRGSLTNDESAESDPNDAPDKATFSDDDNRDVSDRGKFDGEIGI